MPPASASALRRATLAVLGLACTLWWPAAPAAAARAPAPVQLRVAFDRGARLGATTALDVDVHLDPRRVRSFVTDARLLYPESLGVVSSGLGLASCVRPASDFRQVSIPIGLGLAGCPPNAVMGYGTAVGQVRLADGEVIPEYTDVTLLAGPLEQGRLGLVVYIDGRHPFGAKLAYAGTVTGAPGPFGGALDVRLPSVPELAGFAVVALVDLRVTIGSHRIVYYDDVHGHAVPYHPDGIGLPDRCPRGGFPFRAELAFADGSRRVAATRVACPGR
jgi:hypothetical protein